MSIFAINTGKNIDKGWQARYTNGTINVADKKKIFFSPKIADIFEIFFPFKEVVGGRCRQPLPRWGFKVIKKKKEEKDTTYEPRKHTGERHVSTWSVRNTSLS